MSERSDLLQKFNKAFATCDFEFILEQVTDDICWVIIGQQKVEGKEAFEEALKAMLTGDEITITIDHNITHGKEAVLNGTVHNPGQNKTYAFCDIYDFDGLKDARIKKLTSYVIEEKGTN